jgi:hypothetical protein
MASLLKSVIALTIGIVFLIAMLFALVSDVLSGGGLRRQTATRRRRNRPVVAWS